MSSDRYPVGETAVPSSDPNWNYNDSEHIWERDHFLICVKAGLKAAQQKIISYAQVSAITQEPNENPIAFLERLKEALQKFINLDFKSDFKGQIPVPMHIRHQDKVTTATAAGPCCLFTTNTFYNREQERERRKETRHAQMLAALQGSPTVNPESLK